jgi:hypothetical protein
MKKVILSVASMLVLALTLVSCGGGGPKANAEKFLNGFHHMDYAAAKEVSTEDTKRQLESFESIMGSMASPTAKEEAKKIKVDVKEPKVSGDNATVEYTLSNDPSPKTLKMVKQNGKWLAQWSKMDMGGGMGTTPAEGDPGATMPGGVPDTMMAPPAEGNMNAAPNNNGGTTAPGQTR